MAVHGIFNFEFGGKQFSIPNSIPYEGEFAWLKMMCWDDHTVVNGGGNFYLGLFGSIASQDVTLGTLIGEPVGNGYSRQAILRQQSGWPTSLQVNNNWSLKSVDVTFTASAQYNVAIRRAFLASSLDNSGVVLAYSAAFNADIVITPTAPLKTNYELFID